MSNIRKTLNRNIPTKKLLIGIGVALVVVTIAAVFVIRWGMDNSVNMDEFRAAEERCGGNIVSGYTYVDGNGESLVYYPMNDTRSGKPVMGGKYFCSDEEAEAAGYEKYFLSQ